VINPVLAKHFLVDNTAQNYPKNFMALERGLLRGAALSTIEGAEWRRRRHIVQPGFQRDRLLATGLAAYRRDRSHVEDEGWSGGAEKGR